MKKQWLADLNAARATHGHARSGKVSPTFVSWRAMMQRAHYGSHRDSARYLDNGITVCPEWRDFARFLVDMGPRPPGRSIDRIDNAKGYEPGNCRWATTQEQASNRRSTRLITVGGTTKTVAAWAAALGTNRQTIRHRLEAGWPPEKAVSAPVSYRNRKDSL